jgi:sodium transport system permease protein
MAAISLFSGLSLVLLLVILYFLIPFIPFSELGLDLEIDSTQYMSMFVICIPIILFSSALLTVVGSFTKTFKEAQTYLSLMIVLPTLPIIIAQLMNTETSLLIMPIPSLAQSTLIADIIEQGKLDWLQALVSIVTTTIYAWLLARLAIFLYSREQIVN